MLKKNIIIMLILSLFEGMVFYAPIATLYRQNYGLSMIQITFIEGICLLLSLILEIPWGIIADKIGYRLSLIICNSLYLISKIVFFQADCFAWFLLERILLAIVISGLSGLDVSILYLSCNDEQKYSKYVSLYYNLSAMGLVIASSIYLLFLNDNYQLAAISTIISYSIALIFTFFIQEINQPAEAKEKFSSYSLIKKVFSQKRTLIFIIAMSIFLESHQTITVMLSQIKIATLNQPTYFLSIAHILLTLSGLLGLFSYKFLNLQTNPKKIYFMFLLVSFSCFILGVTTSIWLTIFSLIIFRLCFSLLAPWFSLHLNNFILSKQRTTELSIYNMFSQMLAIIITLSYGKIADYSLRNSLFLAVILLLLATALLKYFFKQKIE